MNEVRHSRKWDELIPDVLGLIFKNLSLAEVLTVVPRVCKSWRRAVLGPYCWQEIDIVEWSRNRKPEIVDKMLRLLILRSCGSLRKLSVSGLTCDESIMFIASHAQYLQTLRLPRSVINNSIIERAAGMLSSLTYLDLSYCFYLGAQALEAIGKHCKSLTSLRRIMNPLDVLEKFSRDDEAGAIAATMPKLKHLKISHLPVDTSSVVSILENCKQLELLDIQGCWKVNLDEKFVKRFSEIKIIEDCFDINDWLYNLGSGGVEGALLLHDDL